MCVCARLYVGGLLWWCAIGSHLQWIHISLCSKTPKAVLSGQNIVTCNWREPACPLSLLPPPYAISCPLVSTYIEYAEHSQPPLHSSYRQLHSLSPLCLPIWSVSLFTHKCYSSNFLQLYSSGTSGHQSSLRFNS